jgi:hypothetical protein
MKTLQNNFTTQEQSKRLLELGVPADSADCYLLRTHTKGDTFIVEVLHDELYSKKEKFTDILEYLPCWSAGRLIEIITICCNHYSGNNDIIFNRAAVDHGIIKCLVAYLAIEKKDVSVDFSKLDE